MLWLMYMIEYLNITLGIDTYIYLWQIPLSNIIKVDSTDGSRSVDH